MRETMIEMRGISKAFPGVQALRDCSLEVYQGEVHALLGENGAGKSTLMKILTGIYQADAGEILFNGRETKITSVLDARALGITMIHQELNLLSNLTIAQNIFIGKEIKHHGVFLDERETSASGASGAGQPSCRPQHNGVRADGSAAANGGNRKSHLL